MPKIDTLSIVFAPTPFDLTLDGQVIARVTDVANIPYPYRQCVDPATQRLTQSVYVVKDGKIYDGDERTYEQPPLVWTQTEWWKASSILWMPAELKPDEMGFSKVSDFPVYWSLVDKDGNSASPVVEGIANATNQWHLHDDGIHLTFQEEWDETFPGKGTDYYARRYHYLKGTGMLGFDDLLSGKKVVRA